jgi:hypothetical protein
MPGVMCRDLDGMHNVEIAPDRRGSSTSCGLE